MTPAKFAIAALREIIAGAESRRATWRLSGSQEQYLEACSIVDALELELSGLEKAERDNQALARA